MATLNMNLLNNPTTAISKKKNELIAPDGVYTFCIIQFGWDEKDEQYANRSPEFDMDGKPTEEIPALPQRMRGVAIIDDFGPYLGKRANFNMDIYSKTFYGEGFALLSQFIAALNLSPEEFQFDMPEEKNGLCRFGEGLIRKILYKKVKGVLETKPTKMGGKYSIIKQFMPIGGATPVQSQQVAPAIQPTATPKVAPVLAPGFDDEIPF
jgi:hypothetical protein